MWFRGWRFKNTYRYRYNPHGEALWERVTGPGCSHPLVCPEGYVCPFVCPGYPR